MGITLRILNFDLFLSVRCGTALSRDAGQEPRLPVSQQSREHTAHTLTTVPHPDHRSAFDFQYGLQYMT